MAILSVMLGSPGEDKIFCDDVVDQKKELDSSVPQSLIGVLMKLSLCVLIGESMGGKVVILWKIKVLSRINSCLLHLGVILST